MEAEPTLAAEDAATALSVRRMGGLGWAGVALLAQVALGGLVLVHDAWRSFRPRPENVAARAQVTGLPAFAASVAVAVPAGDTVAYATPSADDAYLWSYYSLSLQLYPRTVWWLTPKTRGSSVAWWRTVPFELPRLRAAASRLGASALVLDWTGARPPRAAPPAAPGSERALVRLVGR